MHITSFKTRRCHVKFRELSLGDCIHICEIPAHKYEYTVTQTLERIIINKNDFPLEEWTVQERYAALAHYCMALNKGKLELTNNLDYENLYVPVDYKDPHVFQFDGKKYTVHHLTGEYAEALEAAIIIGKLGKKTRLTWTLGIMAAVIREAEDDPASDKIELIAERANQIQQLKESEFHTLLAHFQEGFQKNIHILNYWFNDDGIVFLSHLKEGTGQMVPCRFLALSAIPERTRKLCQVVDETGR